MTFDDILSIVMNYIVLGCIADFDVKFLNIYSKTELNCFMGLEININTFRKPKIIVNNDQILEI